MLGHSLQQCSSSSSPPLSPKCSPCVRAHTCRLCWASRAASRAPGSLRTAPPASEQNSARPWAGLANMYYVDTSPSTTPTARQQHRQPVNNTNSSSTTPTCRHQPVNNTNSPSTTPTTRQQHRHVDTSKSTTPTARQQHQHVDTSPSTTPTARQQHQQPVNNTNM